MSKEVTLRDIYSKVTSSEELKKIFDGMTAEEKSARLLTPLSPATPESTLHYTVSDYFEDYKFSYSSQGPARTNLVKTTLNEIEASTEDTSLRLALLTSTNNLGQSAFHSALKFGDNRPIFEALTEKLYQWGGNDFADKWLLNFLTEPLGTMDRTATGSLQDVRKVRPWGSAESTAIQNLCCDYYKPAPYESLCTALDGVRPLIAEWIEANPLKNEGSYAAYHSECRIKLSELAESPDAVQQGGTMLTYVFPKPMFEHLLNLLQKLSPKTPDQLADFLFEQLSQSNGEGGTLMHRTWQGSLLMGPPRAMGQVYDSLGTLIASFDRTLGTEIATALTTKVLSLENDKGQLPLDNFQYNDLPTRNYYIGGFLMNLRRELGDQKKFDHYVREVVAAMLPPDYVISLNAFEPEDSTHSQATKPKRGAQIKP